MPSKKKSVSTPLHLLQQLSDSLLETLEEACSQALVDAEKVLAKLEKRRGKAQEKLHDARLKLQDHAAAGKSKAQGKTRKAIDELEALLDTLKARQTETRTYIQTLKRDVEDSLALAQGVGKVREAVNERLAQRDGKSSQKLAAQQAQVQPEPAADQTPAAKPSRTRDTKAVSGRAPRKAAGDQAPTVSTARRSASATNAAGSQTPATPKPAASRRTATAKTTHSGATGSTAGPGATQAPVRAPRKPAAKRTVKTAGPQSDTPVAAGRTPASAVSEGVSYTATDSAQASEV